MSCTPHPKIRAAPLALAVGCFVLALGLRRGAARRMRFDGRYGQDAYAYEAQARALVESVRARRRPPRFFWPQGYPALAALFIAGTGGAPDAAQWASAYASAAGAALTYLLAYDAALGLPAATAAGASRAGLTAGLTLAFAALATRAGLVTMADSASALWSTLAAWAALRYGRGGHASWLMLCAASLSLATQTRWLNALLALPLLPAALQGGQPRMLLGALGLGAALLAPQALVTGANPDPLLRHDWLLRWTPRNALRRRLQNTDGHYHYRLPIALFYAQPAAHPAGLTPWLSGPLLWGAWRLCRARAYREATVLLGWAGLQYGFLCGIPYQNFRYTLGYLPPLAAIAGIGAAGLRPGPWALLLALTSATQLAWTARDLNRLLALDGPYRAVAAWAATLPPDTTLICFGVTDTIKHRLPPGHGQQIVELYYQSEASLTALLTDAGLAFLALDVENTLGQWHGYLPERLFAFLQTGWQLDEVACFPPFSIFRIERRCA
jgi:hypothetical protein